MQYNVSKIEGSIYTLSIVISYYRYCGNVESDIQLVCYFDRMRNSVYLTMKNKNGADGHLISLKDKRLSNLVSFYNFFVKKYLNNFSIASMIFEYIENVKQTHQKNEKAEN